MMPGAGSATRICVVGRTTEGIGVFVNEDHQGGLECSVGNLQRVSSGSKEKVIASASGDELTDRLPTLFDFLTLLRWPDDAARATGTLLLFCEDGLWKASLHDRDGARTVFVSGGGLLGLLAICDEALACPGTPWRSDRNRRK